MVRLLLATCAVLAGCATSPPARVEYRIISPPEPPEITRPVLPVSRLQPGMDAGTVLQLHRETIVVLIGFVKELEVLLDAYRQQPEENAEDGDPPHK